MICGGMGNTVVAGQLLDCLGSPAAGWAWVAALVVALASTFLAWRARVARRAAQGGPGALWLLTPLAFTFAALCLALATERPVLRLAAADAGSGGHILLLVDASESFWRAPERARAALDLAANRVEGFARSLGPEEASLWRGEILGFGLATRPVGTETPLQPLASALRRFALATPEPSSDLSSGLATALDRLALASGRRMVILVSDGWASPPVAPDLLAEFRAAGIQIHVVTAGAPAAAAGLIAADLAPEHALGEVAILRGTVLGAGTLELRQAGGADRVQDVADGPAPRSLRAETTFLHRGLQGVALSFRSAGGVQGRSLFTLIRGPARVLVYGAAPWAETLPAARWTIERADPRSPVDLAGFDLVVIDALSPAQFAPGYPDRLLAAADGTGLLLVNGGLRGSVEDKQVISDWNGSTLSPILPVDSDPRLFVKEPPPRDVVIMVDVSGSMGSGSRLGSAQSAIYAILDQLRPQDTITILPFSDSPIRPFPQDNASPATVEAARNYTARLQAGGGTAPESALQASASFVSNYCAFFFISDAEFAPPQTAPRCYTTAISVSDDRFPMDVAQWGEELLIGEGGNGRSIRLRYFEPEERNEYYRPGRFLPILAGTDAALDPGLPVDGLAIAYPRVDARMETLHPDPPPDPLFVWRRDARRSGVVTATFLGPMGAEWGQGKGLVAVEAMLSRLLAWSDQDRYLIRLRDSGAAGFRLSVASLGDATSTGQISASFLDESGASTGISLAFDARTGGHVGTFRFPVKSTGSRALLVIQDGSDIQRIPVSFPPQPAVSGGGSDAVDLGVNEAGIAQIRSATGGTALDLGELRTYQSPVVERQLPLHHFLVALAFSCLALAVWSRELRHR